MIRLLVTGGRAFGDVEAITAALDRIHRELGISHLIHGGATGADYLASEWAKANGIPAVPFPAEWKRYGAQAGPLRNSEMVREGRPDAYLAFPGGVGTRDCVRKCVGKSIPPVADLLSPGDQ